jgi:hypothetical protein
VFDGTHHQSYTVTYTRQTDCPAHDELEPVKTTPWSVADTTAGQVLEQARSDLGRDAVVEFNTDLLESLACPECQVTTPMTISLGKVTEAQSRCPACGALRVPALYHSLDGNSAMLDRTLAGLGVPPWDIVAARAGERVCAYELAGDRSRVLGVLEEGEQAP